MEEKLKLAIAVAILIFFGFLVRWGATQTGDQDLETVRVSYGEEENSISFLTAVAKEQGIFESYGLKIDETKTSSQSINLLTSNKVDFTISNLVTPLTLYLNDGNFYWAANIYRGLPDSVLVTNTPDTAKKIRFGLSRLGGAFQVASDVALRNLGWSRENIEYVISGPMATRWAYFERGEIDATFAYPGEGLRIMQSNENLKTYSPIEIFRKDPIPIGIFVNTEMAQSSPKTVSKFIASMEEAGDYVKRNKEKSIEILMRDYGLNEQEANDYYEMVVHFIVEDTKPTLSGLEVVIETIIRINEPKNVKRPLPEFILN
jgi:ABC-type nitrate/sulfonate/bicarbonate transport system substrate-binding protein